jgi:hypothetical protein
MKPVVFLDFDNVLAVHKFSDSFRVLDAAALAIIDAFPDLWLDVFDAGASRNLQTLHKEFKPTYVISSLWASHLSLEQMKKMLKRSGLKFVALNLCERWSTFRNETSNRLSEIEAWLKLQTCQEGHAYLIIDGHVSAGEFSGSSLEERTVICDARIGFSAVELRAAREILHGQCTGA